MAVNPARLQLYCRKIWMTGGGVACGALATVGVVPLELLVGGAGILAVLAFAVGGTLLAYAGSVGLCAFWMQRTPGGLKGWRLGLLLAPGIGFFWNGVEVLFIAETLTRDKSFRRRSAAVGAAVCAAFGMWLFGGCVMTVLAVLGGYAHFPNGPMAMTLAATVPGFLIWVFGFGVTSAMLIPFADRLPVQPTSSRKRRIQLVAVCGAGYGLLALLVILQK